MTATIQSNKSDLLTLLAVISCTLILAAQSIYYMPTSKIEEGTVVVRNDSITTIVIPDRR